MVMNKEAMSTLPVSTKQHRIAEIAKRKRAEPLTLLHHYIDEDWLRVAYSQLRKQSAPGVDRQTVEDYKRELEDRLKSLLKRAKTGAYKAPPVRRVRIPKPGNKNEYRQLGIPTTEDKVLQKAVQMLLDPVYEQEFHEFSFGFRPGKSQHQALQYLWEGIMGKNVRWIIDLDIRKFFDTVKHEILRDLLGIRVRDGVITRLIGKWLKAGVMEDGSVHYNADGTPQGGIISPLLSNVYLHEVLDKWFAEEVQPRLRGRSMIVRFADDAVLGFEHKEEAEAVLQKLTARFAAYGLELHPEKTKLIKFQRPLSKGPKGKDDDERSNGEPKRGSFDFLGFTHYWGKSLRGYWVVKRKTSSHKMREKLKKINEWCRKHRYFPMEYQHLALCRKLKGHYAYYGITGNARSLKLYYYLVKRIWKKWLGRRSWRSGINWDKYDKMIKQTYPLPPIKVVHSIYASHVANR